MYVHENSNDFQMYFPSSQFRQRFFDLVKTITEGEKGMMTNLDEDSMEEVEVIIFITNLFVP